MDNELKKLIEKFRDYKMSPEELEEQRRSFAYGNGKLSNPNLTREDIDKAAEMIKSKEKK